MSRCRPVLGSRLWLPRDVPRFPHHPNPHASSPADLQEFPWTLSSLRPQLCQQTVAFTFAFLGHFMSPAEVCWPHAEISDRTEGMA